eukprot:TRINITY_DN6227_c0_g2_i4.p1 TRINITY_DN6227_c0_g2~~TRINITY_DN6227_c0_g2_i4.p1  ORF type:complete len:241 (-),score=95.39 TRINITY_DN6227_c0_g2_i4:6-728(-)
MKALEMEPNHVFASLMVEHMTALGAFRPRIHEEEEDSDDDDDAPELIFEDIGSKEKSSSSKSSKSAKSMAVRDLKNKSLRLIRENKYQDALECVESAIQMDSNNAPLFLAKANALKGLGEIDAAIVACERCLNMSPKFKKAIELMEELRPGSGTTSSSPTNNNKKRKNNNRKNKKKGQKEVETESEAGPQSSSSNSNNNNSKNKRRNRNKNKKNTKNTKNTKNNNEQKHTSGNPAQQPKE